MAYNPSLREEPRDQRATVLPQKRNTSILDWLENSGRLLARESSDFDYADDEEEINELMAGDDNSFDIDDDDDDVDLDD
jgi:phosphopantothenoylcysteine synthetase/decarboxylase